MLVSTVRKFVTTRYNLYHTRGIAGLPNYDPASKIGMKSLWPACLVILGIYGVGLYVNPIRTTSMDQDKWKKQ